MTFWHWFGKKSPAHILHKTALQPGEFWRWMHEAWNVAIGCPCEPNPLIIAQTKFILELFLTDDARETVHTPLHLCQKKWTYYVHQDKRTILPPEKSKNNQHEQALNHQLPLSEMLGTLEAIQTYRSRSSSVWAQNIEFCHIGTYILKIQKSWASTTILDLDLLQQLSYGSGWSGILSKSRKAWENDLQRAQRATVFGKQTPCSTKFELFGINFI